MDILGLVVGILGVAFAVWERAEKKRQGSNLETFLLGLKAANLPDAAVTQINDMLARLK